MRPVLIITTAILITASACNQRGNVENSSSDSTTIKKIIPRPTFKKPQQATYHLVKTKTWLKQKKDSLSTDALKIIAAVNRTDSSHVFQMDSLIIPDDFTGELSYYLPFPEAVPGLEKINKIIFFSYATQSFGAYENGQLAISGPTNMGRKKDPTPTGLFFTNWKAEETKSTFNDEWELKWNFNIENKLGVGFHEYAMPGYPASHSCLRLQEADAKFLYNWADQWILKGTDNILANGTPVIVFGKYDFDGPKPWKQLINDPKALNISANTLEEETKPFIEKILAEQDRRRQQEEKTK